MQVLNKFKLAVLLGSIAAILAGCSGLPEKIDETTTWSNEKLYSEAQEMLTGGDWARCAKYFEALEGRDPFGEYVQQAQINVAYCNWKDNETAAALQAVNRFIQLHPNHPKIAYAYYLKGIINFNDELGLFGRLSRQDISERDPKAMRDSYNAFKIVVESYPQSPYAQDAAQRMRYIVNALAAHEVHTAHYYYRRGAYLAAVNRAQTALKQYESAPATEDALHIIVLSYRALGQTKLASDAERVLQASFPTSRYLQDERSKLKVRALN